MWSWNLQPSQYISSYIHGHRKGLPPTSNARTWKVYMMVVDNPSIFGRVGISGVVPFGLSWYMCRIRCRGSWPLRPFLRPRIGRSWGWNTHRNRRLWVAQRFRRWRETARPGPGGLVWIYWDSPYTLGIPIPIGGTKNHWAPNQPT